MSTQQHPHVAQESAASANHRPSDEQSLDEEILDLEFHLASQQPIWENVEQARLAREFLATCPPLVQPADVDALHAKLSEVARGELLVLQIGDCAEDPAERTAEHVAAKAQMLDELACMLEYSSGASVLKVGRIAGQFAKPRSKGSEWVDGVELPVFRGHLVNGPEPDPESRRPDPLRMLTGFRAASEIMGRLGWRPGEGQAGEPMLWTSHEALLLDYEQPLVRENSDGRLWLSSTHWPWVGERTRQLYGPHLALLAQVSNPVACKVGPSMSVDDITALCGLLDPERKPGRLTLIARMGADVIEAKLPELVAAVRSAGHPVIWLCDPMHGNNTVTADGLKTRYVSTIVREVHAFQRAVALARGVAGGLHLETTPDDVFECVQDASEAPRIWGRRTTLCDPRLNAAQAQDVIAAWTAPADPVAAARPGQAG